jgi:hypothetical protein
MNRPDLTISYSPQLFTMAKEANARTAGGLDERDSGQNDALVAIVFSAFAIEAFVNEIAGIAAMTAEQSSLPEDNSVATFGALAWQLEESKASTEAKLLLASALFAGRPYAKGVQPFQDLRLLFRLRPPQDAAPGAGVPWAQCNAGVT